MIRGIELRRPWGSRTSELVCTYGHQTRVLTDAAPSTCPVCDASLPCVLCGAPGAPDTAGPRILSSHEHPRQRRVFARNTPLCSDCRTCTEIVVEFALDRLPPGSVVTL